jgi:hypothetical protein
LVLDEWQGFECLWNVQHHDAREISLDEQDLN